MLLGTILISSAIPIYMVPLHVQDSYLSYLKVECTYYYPGNETIAVPIVGINLGETDCNENTYRYNENMTILADTESRYKHNFKRIEPQNTNCFVNSNNFSVRRPIQNSGCGCDCKCNGCNRCGRGCNCKCCADGWSSPDDERGSCDCYGCCCGCCNAHGYFWCLCLPCIGFIYVIFRGRQVILGYHQMGMDILQKTDKGELLKVGTHLDNERLYCCDFFNQTNLCSVYKSIFVRLAQPTTCS